MEEESEEVKEGIIQTTKHDHRYTEGKTYGGLKDMTCSCGHGCRVTPETKLVNGRIIWTKS